MINSLEKSNNFSDTLFLLIIVVTILNVVFIVINTYHIYNKPSQWSQPAFANESAKQKWQNERTENFEKAEKAEGMLLKYGNISRIIAICCLIGSVIAFITKEKKKGILKLIILLIFNIFLIL